MTIDVNKTTCKGDGRCVEVCPIQILQMNEKEHVPEFVSGGNDRCLNCGHCFAVCPHGSITISSMDAEKALRLDPSALPSAQQVGIFLKARRSIRLYKDEPVSKDAIAKLLDITRYAPSGINRQPVNWAVVMGKDNVHGLAGLVVKWAEELVKAKSPVAESLRFDRLVEAWKKGEDRICRGAPAVVIAYGLKDDPMVPQSCTIAGTYLELAAFGLGFGACWAGYVSMAVNMSEDVRKFVGLSSRATAGAAMMVGFPKYRYRRIPERNPARVLWK
jgi:nitroreductase/NAD-dependent dihydropyrimidine dehydrogenase PreA subunit